jgi:hypothetical protein
VLDNICYQLRTSGKQFVVGPALAPRHGIPASQRAAPRQALAAIFHGAMATPPWFARQPQRGRCGSSRQIVGGYRTEGEITGLGPEVVERASGGPTAKFSEHARFFPSRVELCFATEAVW